MSMAKYGGQRSQHPANVNFEPILTGLKSEISAIKGGSRGGEGFRRLKNSIFFWNPSLRLTPLSSLFSKITQNND